MRTLVLCLALITLVGLMTLPVYTLAVLLGALLFGLALRVQDGVLAHVPTTRQRAYIRGVGVCIVTGVIVTVIGAAIMLVHGTREQQIRTMIPITTTDTCANGAPATYLIYVDAPNAYDQLCSPALYVYLQNYAAPTIPVTFVVTKDFGQLRGFHITTVGTFPVDGIASSHGRGCGASIPPPCDPLHPASPWP